MSDTPASAEPIFAAEPFTFTYFDGAKVVHGDPLPLHRRLHQAAAGNLGQVLKDSRSEDIHVAYPAIEKMVAIVRDVFEMAPFDRATGKGATEAHCHDVLDGFFTFLDGEKKSPGPSPTSSAPTAAASSAAP